MHAHLQNGQECVKASNFCKVLNVVEQVAKHEIVLFFHHLEGLINLILLILRKASGLEIEAQVVLHDIAKRVGQYLLVCASHTLCDLLSWQLVVISSNHVLDIAALGTEKSPQAISELID